MVQSFLTFPYLVAGRGPVSVKVERQVLGWSPPLYTPWFQVVGKQARLFWPHIGKIEICDGHQIRIDPDPEVNDEILRHIIMGPAMALLLQQRDLLVLHASTVCMHQDDGPDTTVAFLGTSGEGKSTMAAALGQRGHSILNDDISALQFTPTAISVLPGISRARLWPDVGEFLEGIRVKDEERNSRRPNQSLNNTKISYSITTASQHSQPPMREIALHRIYVLNTVTDNEERSSRAETYWFTSVSQQQAFLALLRYSYCASLLEIPQSGNHFQQCALLAQQIPIEILHRHRCLDDLERIAIGVEERCRVETVL